MTYRILRRTERDDCKCKRSSCKVQSVFVKSWMELAFYRQIFEKDSNFLTIRPLGADGRTDRQTDGRTDRRTDRQTDGQTDGRRDRRTDRQTDLANLIVAFRSFVNATKKHTLNSRAEILVLMSFLWNAGQWGEVWPAWGRVSENEGGRSGGAV